MSEINSANTFEGGLTPDMHPLSIQFNAMTDALNMEIITNGPDQNMLQNIKSHEFICDFPTYSDKKYPFVPLGSATLNSIAYILVGAFDDNGTFLAGGIGTFPSPDWNLLNKEGVGRSKLESKFSFLHNFKATSTSKRIDPFISKKFNFSNTRHIDIVLQPAYDGSVNVIYTDGTPSSKIINSRFSFDYMNREAVLASRASFSRESNIYSDEDWDAISLIQNGNEPITVTHPDPVKGEGFSVEDGGQLRGGGYRYYLKYATQEGNTTDVIYESPLIPISGNGFGINKDQFSNKQVKFYLSNLDMSYAGVFLYFAHADGAENPPLTELFKVDYLYKYDNSSLVISHTGQEKVLPIDSTELSTSFSAVEAVASMTTVNDRLVLAGVKSTLDDKTIKILKEAAEKVTLWEKTMPITTSYADPETASKNLGYWKGEVYEFAGVFIIDGKGLSPAFPVRGMDNFYGDQKKPSFTESVYLNATVDSDGFSSTHLINTKGVFRFSESGPIFTPGAGDGTRHVTYIEADTKHFASNAVLQKIITGFFLVRRRRNKNVLFQGVSVPTLKVPSRRPATVFYSIRPWAHALDAARVYLNYFQPANTKRWLGLNSKYISYKRDTCNDKDFNIDFDTVFLPQPTQQLRVLTDVKSWAVAGNIGQVTPGKYGETIDNTGKGTGKFHFALLSNELDINLAAINTTLSGLTPKIDIQEYQNQRSPLGYCISNNPVNSEDNAKYSTEANKIVYVAEPVGFDAAWISTNPDKSFTTIITSGSKSFSKNSFSASTDRSIGFMSDGGQKDEGIGASDKVYTDPFVVFNRPEYTTDLVQLELITNSNKLTYWKQDIGGSGPSETKKASDFYPYSILSQKYSTYLGVETEIKDSPLENKLPLFLYDTRIITDLNKLLNSARVYRPQEPNVYYLNTGHLTNVFGSSRGRWTRDDIRQIYKFDNELGYSAVSPRLSKEYLNTAPVIKGFRGDAFISTAIKKVSYTHGIDSAPAATEADALVFGVGLLKTYREDDGKLDNVPEEQRKDEGRNILPVGEGVQIVSFSNVNADLRSKGVLTDADKNMKRGPKSFFPVTRDIFSDPRPDSTTYNFGYSVETNPVEYFKLSETAPSLNTVFPNRVMLSEKSQAQAFINAYRNFKGFNFRDYGVSLGPIIKVISIKGLLLTIHPSGVLGIGIDEKTLISEGTSVFVNTAQALNPEPETISTMYGSFHPESIVSTTDTIAGVDYTRDAVWLFTGQSLEIISQFTVTTVLADFRKEITNATFAGAVAGASYRPRVYSTFDRAKQALCVTYIAENTSNGKQTHVGALVYNLILQKWTSRLSEGAKFVYPISASMFVTGFVKNNSIWRADAGKKADGTISRGVYFGVPCKYEVEFIINKEPSYEKVLNNLQMICTKFIPDTIIYTVSGDVNDAAANIWDASEEKTQLVQPIITRNKSPRSGNRLGILDENAYYKNSGLYIEVGKIGYTDRASRGRKRIRDKSIKVRLIYSGDDDLAIQGILSTLSLSFT